MLYITVLFGSQFFSRYLTCDSSVILLEIPLCWVTFEHRLFNSIFIARLLFSYATVDMCDMCFSLYDCFSNFFFFLQHVHASEGPRILGVHEMNVRLGEPKVETSSCLENKAAIVMIQLCLICGNMEKNGSVYTLFLNILFTFV